MNLSPTPAPEIGNSKQQFEDFDYHLPQELIAQHPGDVLVVNNSRVLPARLLGRRSGVRSMLIGKKNPARGEYLKSEIEALLVRRLDERTWQALVRPGRKVRIGERL